MSIRNTFFWGCVAVIVFIGCSKREILTGDREIQPTALRGCPQGNCKFSYSEWTDIEDAYSLPVFGRFRVFKMDIVEGGVVSTLFLKAPMDVVAFNISSTEIASHAIWQVQCPQCRLMPMGPVSGTVRGNRIPRGGQNISESWVLEIDIEISHKGEGQNEELNIKEIFFPDFIRTERPIKFND